MLSAEDNELLTRVGPGTPGGELLRRYWHVVAVASELTEAKPKKRVRILGEDLVLYRLPTKNGEKPQYGLVAEHCPHRGVSLYYGFVEDDGIRCPYHGWKFDCSGRCLEQPFEPEDSTFKDRIVQPTYPVEKMAGFLFAYMGPAAKKPPLPRWDVLVRNDGERHLQVYPELQCNWLQAMENSVDPVHTYYLHAHTMRMKNINEGQYYYRPQYKLEFEVVHEPAWSGIQKRRIFTGEEAQAEAPHPLIFPNMLLVPTPRSYNMHLRTPLDDTHTRIFHVAFRPSPDGSEVAQPEDPPFEYSDTKNSAGEFHLDTFPSQDQMAWETQGPIFDRQREKLGESDRGVTLFRKLLREQILIVQDGGDPVGTVKDIASADMIQLIPHGYSAFGFRATEQR